MDPRPKRFRTEEEVEFAVESKQITLQQPIEYLLGRRARAHHRRAA